MLTIETVELHFRKPLSWPREQAVWGVVDDLQASLASLLRCVEGLKVVKTYQPVPYKIASLGYLVREYQGPSSVPPEPENRGGFNCEYCHNSQTKPFFCPCIYD
jgi:hypothetical protein